MSDIEEIVSESQTTTKSFDLNLIISLIKRKSERISYTKRKGKSDVWKTFDKVIFDGKISPIVKCVLCDKTFNFDSNQGNSHLRRHQQTCVSSVKSLNLKDMFKDYSQYKKSITESAVICCCVDLLPFNLIEGQGLKLLANELVKVGKQND